MSRFFSDKYRSLVPYTPGEQPKNTQYIKLNTNESPFPLSEKAIAEASNAANLLQLYPDPECRALTQAFADLLGVSYDEVLMTNGSDEILNFAFMAYCDDTHPAAFPNITYGFYPVFAEINRVPYCEISLNADFTVNVEDYCGIKKTIFIANPNAPTGIALSCAEIERIVQSNPDNIVVVDEAYVDFGAESCVPLIHKYDNLLVTQTCSKSRSMAGARLGFGIGNPALIQDLNTIKYATNPYNINRMTMAAGLGVAADEAYTRKNCKTVAENRAYATAQLQSMGFSCTDSKANFIFAMHPNLDGEYLYQALKTRGILIRHFTKPEICAYNRITVGTREQMDCLISQIREIMEER